MSPEITLLLLIIAGAIVVYCIRRSSEPGIPKQPVHVPEEISGPAPLGTKGNWVPVAHPMIRRAAEKAITRGNEVAKYLVKEDGEIYFVVDAIGDPTDRQRALDIITRIQVGKDADMSEVMWLLRRIFRE